MRFYKVRQRLVSNPLGDVAEATRLELNRAGLDVPPAEVAVTAGSRGISNIAVITRTAGEWLRSRGARPFLVPCMGSHNGATAAGQRRMVEALGMTEEFTGMEIRASMDVVKLGGVATGDVYMDRHCYESAGVLVINRIKLHTCFSGPVQSGLMKMMVVGMGKIRSAETFHRAPTPRMGEMILEMGELILRSGKILGGVAIVEDGFDQTAEIHALRPEEIGAAEPALLERHKRYFPRLPVDDINVLIVDTIGKTYSGTGMDTNVIGYRGIKHFEDLERPRINVVAALALAEQSHGNAIGVGLADFITRRLRDAIDEEKTFINVFTTGDMERAKIPATLPDDETVVRLLEERFGGRRWVLVHDTLHLDVLFVSEDLKPELESHPLCEVDPAPVDLSFTDGRHRLDFGPGR
jgi:hypothetical protein